MRQWTNSNIRHTVTDGPFLRANISKCTFNPKTKNPYWTLLAIWYSFILSTCPNHLNTLWSALLANSLSIPALLRTSSFLTIHLWHSNQTSQILLPNPLLLRTLFRTPQALKPSFILWTTSLSHPPSAATVEMSWNYDIVKAETWKQLRISKNTILILCF